MMTYFPPVPQKNVCLAPIGRETKAGKLSDSSGAKSDVRAKYEKHTEKYNKVTHLNERAT